jgi:hypothetical protein
VATFSIGHKHSGSPCFPNVPYRLESSVSGIVRQKNTRFTPNSMHRDEAGLSAAMVDSALSISIHRTNESHALFS